MLPANVRCNAVGADASVVLSSGRGDLAPTIFGEGIVLITAAQYFNWNIEQLPNRR